MVRAAGQCRGGRTDGLTLWFWALVLTYTIWGAVAVFIGLFLLGIGVVPVAMLATLFDGQAATTLQLLLLTVVTFGARSIGVRLALQSSRERQTGPFQDL